MVDVKQVPSGDASSQSSGINTDSEKGARDIQVEHVHTNERVPGHPEYYEKNGVRTEGDGQDHANDPEVR